MEIIDTELMIKPYSFSVKKFILQYPPGFISNNNFWGLDPGTANLGLAWINSAQHTAIAWEINGNRLPDASERILNLYDLLESLVLPIMSICPFQSFAVIEGASYGSFGAQQELAEVRSMATLLFELKCNIRTSFVPPHSVRKTVFGSAKIHAETIYTELPKDAAAALSCAMASLINYSNH